MTYLIPKLYLFLLAISQDVCFLITFCVSFQHWLSQFGKEFKYRKSVLHSAKVRKFLDEVAQTLRKKCGEFARELREVCEKAMLRNVTKLPEILANISQTLRKPSRILCNFV